MTGIFFFATASRPALEPTKLPIQCIPWSLIPEVKRPGHEADNSPQSISKVKNTWSYTSTPPIHLNGVGAWLSIGHLRNKISNLLSS